MASSLYDYLTDTGVIIPDTSTLKDDTEDMFKAIFGDDIDMTAETPTGRLVEAFTVLKSRVMGITAQNSNQINENYATGVYLDSLASLYSINRISAIPTVVECVLSGVKNTNVPSGSKVADSDGHEYVINESVVLSDDGTGRGKATALFTCTETGEIACPKGAITEIVTSISGWETAENKIPGVIGSEVESDYALRKRIKESKWDNSTFVGSIISSIRSINTVRECKVWENYTNQDDTTTFPTTPTASTFKAHSVMIIVDGSKSEDEKNSIAEAIYKTKPAGTDMSIIEGHGIGVDYTESLTGVTYAMKYSEPEVISIDVSVTVRNWSSLGDQTSVIEKVRSAVISWMNGDVPNVDGASIGQTVYAYEIGSAVSDSHPVLQITEVGVKTHGSATYGTSVSIAKWQRAHIDDESNISVTCAS